jgi:hypothetical protein
MRLIILNFFVFYIDNMTDDVDHLYVKKIT